MRLLKIAHSDSTQPNCLYLYSGKQLEKLGEGERSYRQHPQQQPFWTVNANVWAKSWKRRNKRRLEPPLSNRRPSLYSAGSEAAVLVCGLTVFASTLATPSGTVTCPTNVACAFAKSGEALQTIDLDRSCFACALAWTEIIFEKWRSKNDRGKNTYQTPIG